MHPSITPDVLALLRQAGPLSANAIRRTLGLHHTYPIQTVLWRLHKKGEVTITSSGIDPVTHYTVYLWQSTSLT